MAIKLDNQQKEAVNKLKNGSILQADVGTGKSRTALAYYYIRVCGGGIKVNDSGRFRKMLHPKDLYIITTAKKRDKLEWDEELSWFLLNRGENTKQPVCIYVDSWNNIGKYRKVFDAFFIFDEQRLTGSGPWVKSFYDIARKNKWIMLSATPGDKWEDYIPVFVANGFYRNKTEFMMIHAIKAPYLKYPKIIGYHDEGLLLKHKRDITVNMYLKKDTVPHYIPVPCDYDKMKYRKIWRDRWDPYDDEPIEETGKLFYLLRKVVNSDISRLSAVENISRQHKKLVIFYNHTYELELLRELFTKLKFDIGEWNGKVHSEIPKGSTWAYLVQYSAGCEGWNCIDTDTMIFYSQSYSYRQTVQAEGRINRRNTPFTDLYYYKLKSHAPIDLAIARALSTKKDFNIRTFKGR